jgi:hypothetical protein
VIYGGVSLVVEPQELSGSVDGEPILVVAIASPGDTVHTVTNGTDYFHELFISFINIHTAAITVSVEWGTQVAAKVATFVLEPEIGPYLYSGGFPLNNGKSVTVFASVTNKILVQGYVYRYRKSVS